MKKIILLAACCLTMGLASAQQPVKPANSQATQHQCSGQHTGCPHHQASAQQAQQPQQAQQAQQAQPKHQCNGQHAGCPHHQASAQATEKPACNKPCGKSCEKPAQQPAKPADSQKPAKK